MVSSSGSSHRRACSIACSERSLHFQIGFQERAEQPGPDRAVVIAPHRDPIAGRRSGRDNSGSFLASVRSPTGVSNSRRTASTTASCCGARQRAVGKAHGENLIGPHRRSPAREPSTTSASPRNGLSQNALRKLSATRSARDVVADEPQGVIPEGVDLDGLALPRRKADAVALGVHPGELRVGVALADQSVGWIDLDVIARPLRVASDDRADRPGGEVLRTFPCRWRAAGIQTPRE